MSQLIKSLTGVEFKAPADRSKKKTTFILKSLNNSEFIQCTNMGFVDHAAFVHKGLTDWRDMLGENGKPVEFDPELICQIEPSMLLDISLEIQSISSLTEKERKNLSSPKRSSRSPKNSTAKRATTTTAAKKKKRAQK